MRTLLFLLIVNLLITSPQDQAEGLYDNAVTFMNAGKYKEALTDFETIINSFGDTDWAPRALLDTATYYLDIENDPEKALGYLSKLQSEFAGAREAPAAYYYKALIAARVGRTRVDLEGATADLVRMNNLFPRNHWSGSATFLFGRLTLRLGDYKQSLSHFQRLEFSEPNSPHLVKAWLLSARAAYRDGMPAQAALILARLQARYPDSEEAEIAAAHLRLLSRFQSGKPGYTLDTRFFGGAPKRFRNPTTILISEDEQLAILAQKSVSLGPLADPAALRTLQGSDVVDFTRDRDGGMMLVYENRVVRADGEGSSRNLSVNGDPLRDLKSAAVDDFGRLFVTDDRVRDLLAFDTDGRLLKTFNLNKAKLVRAFGSEILVLAGDGSTLRRYDGNLAPSGRETPSVDNVVDFRFDTYGNLYVLHDKGYQVSIYAASGPRLAGFNLKSGAFPLKQANGIAVDTSGALYLADRRGGAVYRFQ